MEKEEAVTCVQSILRAIGALQKAKRYKGKITTRTQVAKEILSTEQNYVERLKVLLIDFLEPLKRQNFSGVHQLLTDMTEIEYIYTANAKMYNELKAVIENWDNQTSCIGDIFLRFASSLKLYAIYVARQGDASTKLNSLREKNRDIDEFLRKTESAPVAMGLPLAAYLIEPVQRLPRYQMLIEQMVKLTWSDHRDYLNLIRAFEQIRQVAFHVNEKTRFAEQQKKLEEIQSRLVGVFQDTLVQATRKLVKDAPVTVLENEEAKKRHIYVFNDIILLTKRGPLQKVENWFKLIEIDVFDKEPKIMDDSAKKRGSSALFSSLRGAAKKQQNETVQKLFIHRLGFNSEKDTIVLQCTPEEFAQWFTQIQAAKQQAEKDRKLQGTPIEVAVEKGVGVSKIAQERNERERGRVCEDLVSKQVVDKPTALNLKTVFKKLDADFSGELDATELLHFLQNLGFPCTYLGLKKLIGKYASSGQIKFPDFVNLIIGENLVDRLPRETVADSQLHTANPKYIKLAEDLAKETHLAPQFILHVLDSVFDAIAARDNKEDLAIPQDDFINIFEPTFGSASFAQNLFLLFVDRKKVTEMKPQNFFKGLGLLTHGSSEERLKFIFDVFDDDESGLMESNEINKLKDLMLHSAMQNDVANPKNTVDEILNSLSEDKCETITKDNFIHKGKKDPLLLDLLIPPTLLQIEFLADTQQPESNLDESTLELFTLLHIGPYDQEAAQRLLLDADVDAIDLLGNSLLHAAARADSIAVIEFVLSKSEKNLNSLNGNSETPLMIAAERGHEKAVEALLKANANVDVQDKGGGTALHRALKEKEEIRGPGLFKSIQLILAANPNLQLETTHQNTALDFAARYNQREHIDSLISAKADINHKSHSNYTPLHWAASSGQVACLKKLLQNGADSTLTSSTGLTIAHLAASAGSLNCLEVLKEQKANFCALDNIGRTPLHFAALNGNVRCVRFLIMEEPAALKVVDSQGNTAFKLAQSKGNKEAASVINNGPLQEQSEFSKRLLKLFRRGENDTVKKMLLKEESDVHVANENGTTLVHYSAMQGRSDILNLLLSRGANPNIGNNRLTRPLHKAVQRGELSCTKMLLEAGADPNVQDEDGITPLHRGLRELEIGKKTSQITACLLECLKHKPKVGISDNRGYHAFDIVAESGLLDLVEPFLAAGADIEHKNPTTGYTPLVYAAATGQVKMVEKLVSLGALAHREDDPICAINVAVKHNKLQMVTELMKHGCKPSPLLINIAAQVDVALLDPLVRILEDMKMQAPSFVNNKDQDGNTPLHLALNDKVIQKLISLKADITIPNNQGQTPLIYHLEHCAEEPTISALLHNKANLSDKNKDGLTPLNIAAITRNTKVVGLLTTTHGLKFEMQSSDNSIEFRNEGARYPTVLSGTKEALLKHLVCREFADEDFYTTFFATHQSISDAESIFREIKTDYERDPSEKIFPQKKYRPPPGPIAALAHWVKHFFDDFAMNSSLMQEAFEFTEKLPAHHKPLAVLFAQQMEEALHKASQSELKTRRVSITVQRPEELSKEGPKEISREKKSAFGLSTLTKGLLRMEKLSHHPQTWYVDKKLALAKVPTDLFVQQLALNCASQFNSIPLLEFMNHTSNPQQAPTIAEVLNRSRVLSNWMCGQVLNEGNKKERSKIVVKLIHIGKLALEGRNFQGAAAVYDALTNPAIARLAKTFELVGKSHQKEELFQVFSNTSAYQKRFRAGSNGVPWLKTHLKEMAVFAPAMDSKAEQIRVNFVAHFQFAIQLLEMRTAQQAHTYHYEEDPTLQPFLFNPTPIPKELMAQSFKLEPRN